MLPACQSETSTTTPSITTSTPATTELPEKIISALSVWSDNKTPVPFGTLPSPTIESPDDFVPTPGGGTYRANAHESGVVNPWPEIEVVVTELTNGSNILTVVYRKTIETRPGEIHLDNIVLNKKGGLASKTLSLYTTKLPEGMIIFNGGNAGSPLGLGARLYINTPSDLVPGTYIFYIGIILDNEDYGTVPCVVNVIK
jgi:hypothetical protein